jgi:hypothetical protein
MGTYALAIIIPLLQSLFFYVLFRPDDTVINQLITRVFHADLSTDRFLLNHFLQVPDFVIYSLPSGLWIFSITLLARKLSLQVSHWKINLTYLPIGFVVGLEMMQLFHLTDGTFDPMDILVSVVCWGLAVLTSKAYFAGILPQRPTRIRLAFFLGLFASAYLADVLVRL